jgi:hypothetical protein
MIWLVVVRSSTARLELACSTTDPGLVGAPRSDYTDAGEEAHVFNGPRPKSDGMTGMSRVSIPIRHNEARIGVKEFEQYSWGCSQLLPFPCPMIWLLEQTTRSIGPCFDWQQNNHIALPVNVIQVDGSYDTSEANLVGNWKPETKP